MDKHHLWLQEHSEEQISSTPYSERAKSEMTFNLLVVGLIVRLLSHLSESSIVDLSAKMKKAKQEDSGGKVDAIKALISQIPASGGGDDKMQQGEEMKKAAIDINPDSIAPEEVQQRLKEILVSQDEFVVLYNA